MYCASPKVSLMCYISVSKCQYLQNKKNVFNCCLKVLVSAFAIFVWAVDGFANRLTICYRITLHIRTKMNDALWWWSVMNCCNTMWCNVIWCRILGGVYCWAASDLVHWLQFCLSSVRATFRGIATGVIQNTLNTQT